MKAIDILGAAYKIAVQKNDHLAMIHIVKIMLELKITALGKQQ